MRGSRKGARLLGRTTALALAATLVSACGVVDGFGTSEFAEQDAPTIARAAYADMAAATSMRVTGTMQVKGDRFFVDLQLSEDQCTGDYRQNRGSLEIRQTPRANWFRGDRALVNDVLRSLPQYQRGPGSPDKWRKAAKGHPWCKLKTWVSAFKVRKDGTDTDGRTMRVGEETEMDGVRVVEVITDIAGVAREPVAYVAVDAPHRVVKVEGDDPEGSFNLAFSRYDDEFEVTVPTR